jgi:lysophospholipase L1-like esterase
MEISDPALAPAPRPIPWRRRLLFATGLVAAFGALQEVCFRLVFPVPEVSRFNRAEYSPILLTDSRYKQAVRDGMSNLTLRLESEPDGFAFDHTLNLYGFRGLDFPIAPPGDRPRVVFIGDSFVEGQGAADDQTIPVQFARALGAGHRVEAINLGVVATGFPEYVRLTRDALPLLRPDAVFLVVYANDLPAPPFRADRAAAGPAVKRINPYQPRAVQVARRLRRGATVPRFFHSGPFPFFEPVPSPVNPLTTNPPPPDIDASLLDAMRRGKINPWLFGLSHWVKRMLRHDFATGGDARPYLDRVASLCRQNGARLVVAYIPSHVTANPAYLDSVAKLGTGDHGPLMTAEDAACRNQQAHLRAATAALGIPFLDLTDEFIAAERSGGRMYWAYDTHCNADGYRLAASAFARYWSEGRLPRARPAEAPRVADRPGPNATAAADEATPLLRAGLKKPGPVAGQPRPAPGRGT